MVTVIVRHRPLVPTGGRLQRGLVELAYDDHRPLQIALIAPPWYPMPPQGYGGVELVVTLLARELRRQGHKVTLFGADGSESGTTICAPAGLDVHLGQDTQVLHEMTYLSRVEQMMRELGPFDVISDHSGFGGALITSLPDAPTPVLHTVHGRIGASELEFLASLRANGGFIAISDSQRRSAPLLQWAGVVHNAVDVKSLCVSAADRDPRYLLCLARICEEKGQDVAIEVARRCGLHLILAGKIEQTPISRAFFRRRVEPFIDGEHVQYLPNVTGALKARLIAGATAMLAPISWPEPFGLSIVEAMVSGTPAVSFRQGSAPELIESGISGFVVDHLQEMVDAVAFARDIDPFNCARVARDRFSPQVMAGSYLRVYRRAMLARLAAPGPVARLTA
jgi:glycosyltransferase involved in cell wall biosynthesis